MAVDSGGASAGRRVRRPRRNTRGGASRRRVTPRIRRPRRPAPKIAQQQDDIRPTRTNLQLAQQRGQEQSVGLQQLTGGGVDTLRPGQTFNPANFGAPPPIQRPGTPQFTNFLTNDTLSAGSTGLGGRPNFFQDPADIGQFEFSVSTIVFDQETEPVASLTGAQPSTGAQRSAILDPIQESQVSTNPLVRLTAGGLFDLGTNVLDRAAASSAQAGIDYPLSQLTAGSVGAGLSLQSTELRSILVSPDVAFQQGVLYDPNDIQEGPAGPGPDGNGAFIVTDLADVHLLRAENPDLNIYYNDVDDPGPLRAVGGLAAFLPALDDYLLRLGRGEEIPPGLEEILIANGLLEEDFGDLFPEVPFGFGGGFGFGGFGGSGGGGRSPGVGAFASGLFNWRISA